MLLKACPDLENQRQEIPSRCRRICARLVPFKREPLPDRDALLLFLPPTDTLPYAS